MNLADFKICMPLGLVIMCFSMPLAAIECGVCVPDPTSPTGGSKHCILGPGKPEVRLNCHVNEPPPPKPRIGADLDITSVDIPVCSEAGRKKWQQVADESLGVTGYDLKGHNIDFYPAEKFGRAHKNNWYPNDDYKHTMCGKLQRFKVADLAGAEMDWNLLIIPNQAFTYLFSDVVEYAGGITGWWDEWLKCGDESLCVEAELTPDERFYENPWFPKSSQISPLENEDGRGPTVCMYGPWVREWAHAYRPEIHPAELLWWKQPRPFPGPVAGDGFDTWWLMQMHDDSNRFDYESDFDFGWPLEDPPHGWDAWASAPRLNMFNIAFRMPTKGGRTEFVIEQAADAGESAVFSSHEIRTHEFYVRISDATDRQTHDLRYDGRIVARIREQQQKDSDIKVAYLAQCRNADNTQLQGFLRVGSAISRYRPFQHGGEGYHVMIVRKSFERYSQALAPVDRTAPSATVSSRAAENTAVATRADRLTPKHLSIKTRAVENSVARAQIEGAPTLVGDMNVKISKLANGTVPAVQSVSTTINGQRKSLDFETANGWISIQNVPLVGTEKINIQLASGKILEAGTGGIGLAPVGQVQTADMRLAADQSSAWRGVSEALGVTESINIDGLSPLSVANAVRVETIPVYGPLIEGQVALEDSSVWAQRVNQVLRSGTKKQVGRLFGQTSPISAEWDFAAFDLATGKPIPVKVSPASDPAAIQVKLIDGVGGKTGFTATFPASGEGVYELVGRVTMQDGLGGQGEAVYRVSSHAIQVSNRSEIDKLIVTLANLAGVPASNLLRASKLRQTEKSLDDPAALYLAARDPALRRPRMVRLFATQAAQDRSVSVGELNSLFKGTQLYKSGQADRVTPLDRLRQRVTPH